MGSFLFGLVSNQIKIVLLQTDKIPIYDYPKNQRRN